MQSLLQSLFPTPFLRNKKIVLDCAHGATSSIAPQIFKMLGAEVIALYTQPTGTNINEQCGSVYPQAAQAMVLQEQADAGFAFDGDGDRMIAINRNGDLKNGDDVLALLSQHPVYTHAPGVVGTIMSNQGLALFLAQQNKKLLRTPVGDKHIARKLLEENLVLGGEQSGHIIVRDHLNAGDGIVTALRVLETLTITNDWEMNTFTPFPQTLINVPITTKKDLTDQTLQTIIAQHEAQLGNGRIIVRYSGTEPLLRVMVEEQDQDIAHTVGNNLVRALHQALHT
jgi:phosphoglucosamine mutase